MWQYDSHDIFLKKPPFFKSCNAFLFSVIPLFSGAYAHTLFVWVQYQWKTAETDVWICHLRSEAQFVFFCPCF